MFFIVIDGSIEKLLNYSTIIIAFQLSSLLRWLSMYPHNFFICLYSTAASSSETICDMLQPPAHPSTLATNGYTLNIIPTWRWCDRDNVIMRSPDHHRPDLSGFAANCSRIILDHQCRIYLLSENLIDTVRIPNRFPGFPGDIPRSMIVRFKPLVRDSSGPLCIRQVSKRILENVRRFFNSASCLFQNFCLLLWPVLFSA